MNLLKFDIAPSRHWLAALTPGVPFTISLLGSLRVAEEPASAGSVFSSLNKGPSSVLVKDTKDNLCCQGTYSVTGKVLRSMLLKVKGINLSEKRFREGSNATKSGPLGEAAFS